MAIIKEGDVVFIHTKRRLGNVLAAEYGKRGGSRDYVEYWASDHDGARGGPRGALAPTERWYTHRQIERADEAIGLHRK